MSIYQVKCHKCNESFDEDEIYEYRGLFACVEHIDEITIQRDAQRNEIIREEDNKTKVFKGLDLGDSKIGKANNEILKKQIEIAKKESIRLKQYERPDKE